MELLQEIEVYLNADTQEAKEGAELLSRIEQKNPRAIGLLRRAGKNPKRIFAPHIARELKRYFDRYSQNEDQEPAEVAASPAEKKKAKPAAPKKDVYVAPPLKKPFSAKEFEELPQVIKDFVKENDKSQKIRAKAKHALEEVKHDETRHELAKTIAELTEQIDNNYAAIDYYKKNGHLPNPPAEEEEETPSLVEVQADLRNARSRRSKAKSGLKNAKTKKTTDKYEAKLKEEEDEVFRLEALEAKLQEDESLRGKGKG